MREIPAGHRIWIKHHRNPDEGAIRAALRANHSQPHPLDVQTPVNVITEACLLDADENIVSQGFALCGNLDQFNKKRGRDIATGRCLRAYYDALD